MKLRFSSRDAAEFRRIFKAELKNYWNVLGFDVVKFDDDIVRSDSTAQSCAEAVQQTWGVEALRFIRELIA